jgi:signal peptidase II
LSDPAAPDTGRTTFAAKVPWFALAAAALAADLWTKHIVFYPEVLSPEFDRLPAPPVVGHVCPGWQTVLTYNNGVTFGLAAGFGKWLISVFTGVVIVLLVRALWKAGRHERVRPFALSIIVGGAVGNLYDRALRPLVEPDTHPGVRDFLDWYAPRGTALADWLVAHNVNTHWYTFNVADAFIVSGVLLLAWKILREKPPEESPETAKAPA